MSRRRIRGRSINDGADVVLNGWKADQVIEAAGRGPCWSRLHNGFLVYAKDVPDVVAAAGYMNVDVEIVGEVNAPISGAPVPGCGVSAGAPVQLALFGGEVA